MSQPNLKADLLLAGLGSLSRLLNFVRADAVKNFI